MFHFETRIIFVLLLLLGSLSQAAINRAAIMMAAPSKILQIHHGLSPELLDTYNRMKAEEKPFDMSQVVPLDLEPTNNSNLIFSKIADRSVSSFFNSSAIRATPLGKTATQVEQKLKQDVSFQTQKIEHKITFQLQAFQGVAKVDYKGYTNATVSYQAANSAMGLEVFDKLPSSKDKDLVLGHLTNNTERVSSLSVRWQF